MWPFKRRTTALIDEAWLDRKKIPLEYRDAFGRKSSELKSEISRNIKNLENERDRLITLESEQRSLNLQIDTKEAKKAELAKKKGAERDRNLEIIDTEILALNVQLDRIGEGKVQAIGKIDSLNETVKMLQAIRAKHYKTPNQLTQKVEFGSGDLVSNLRDSLPGLNEVDNSDILSAYAEQE